MTLSGNWILSSQLPIDLQFKLEAVLSSSMFRRSNQDKNTRDTSGDLMGLFPSYSTLPSCLAPDEKFSAVYFAGVRVEDGETWSEPMPLALSKDKWAKPHLLTHVSWLFHLCIPLYNLVYLCITLHSSAYLCTSLHDSAYFSIICIPLHNPVYLCIILHNSA